MRRKLELLAAVLFLIGLLAVTREVSRQVSSAQADARRNLVYLDAGHGGSDSGKIGINQALEKDVNLQITLKVKKKLEKDGMKVKLTRKKDEMLCKKEDSNKKVTDLKRRVEMINKEQPAIAVSIHQNSYPDAAIWGAQVFYFTHSSEGKEAAEMMQKELLACSPDNTRQAKANDTYYLLKKTEVPLLIVECGFLSNPEEAEKLTDEKYQETLAEAISKGIESWVVK